MSFELHPGEVLGVVALEGQGQDELFDILAGSDRPSGGELQVDGKPVSFRHPADAIRAGLVYVAADRAEALLPQRSVRENIALPFVTRLRRWGPINIGREGKAARARSRPCRSTRVRAREVRRLSGGNQQKVTIARWVAGGVRTMLCFDPTRGIDIRTKNQIYVLLRDLAAAGAAVLIYTSELKEIQLACDRVIVIFGGRVVGEIDAADADEPALLRAAYDLKSDALMPEEIAAELVAERGAPRDTAASTRRARRMSAAAPPSTRPRPGPAETHSRRCAATRGRSACWSSSLLLVFTRLIQPTYGPTGIQGLANSVLPLALAATAQAIVVISGGIDLSIGSMMALTSVVAASSMQNQSDQFAVVVVIGVLLLGLLLGAVNGAVIVVTRVPDIVVTLAMAFVWAGCALLVLKTPGGGSAQWLKDLVLGPLGNEWIPKAGVLLIVIVARDLDPGLPLAARPVPVRDRQQPAGRVPQRRVRRPHQDLRLHARRAVLRPCRPRRSRRAPGGARRFPGRTRC